MYLDANFFIFANFSIDGKGQKARKILGQISGGKRAVTSSLVLDEVMWVLLKNNQKDEIRAIIDDIYGIKNLEVKPVDSLVPLRAVDFLEKHKLKPRDAFHVAVMESIGVSEIVTDDKDFDRVDGIKRVKLG